VNSVFSWAITDGWWISLILMLLVGFSADRLIKGIGDGYLQGVIQAVKDNPIYMIARIGLWLLFVVSIVSSLTLAIILIVTNPVWWLIIIQIIIIIIDVIFIIIIIVSELFG